VANTYYDYTTGSAGNSGLTPALPKATRDQAVTASGAGDRVIALPGSQQHESGHFIFDDNRIEAGYTYRTAILKPAASETTYAARTSSALSAANNPWRCDWLVFDGQAGNSGAGTTQTFDIVQDAAEDLQLYFTGCEWRNGVTQTLLLSMRRGTQWIVNGKLTGSPTAALLQSSASLSGDGAQTLLIDGLEFSGSLSSGTLTGAAITKIDNLVNTLTCRLKAVTGVLTATGTAAIVGLNIKTVDPFITGFDLTISAESSSNAGHFGILLQGQATAVCTGAIVSYGQMRFNAKGGYAIALGQPTTAANITGAIVEGCTVSGMYSTTITPHLYLIGQGTTGCIIRGSVATDSYVGFLASKCTNGTLEGNLALDCYGPGIYVKGTTAVTVRDNIVCHTGKYDNNLSGDKGIACIAVNDQGGTNTAGATITRNLVLVADVSKIQNLACIMAGQVCTFDQNVYVVPDTVDPATALLFGYGGTLGSNAPTDTIAAWNARAEVGTDILVLMPQQKIKDLIASVSSYPGIFSYSNGFPFTSDGRLVVSLA